MKNQYSNTGTPISSSLKSMKTYTKSQVRDCRKLTNKVFRRDFFTMLATTETLQSKKIFPNSSKMKIKTGPGIYCSLQTKM